jgi:AmmeMemoRadiSam system protein B
LDQKAILTAGHQKRGACSVGAVMAAAKLAELKGAKGVLVDGYASSDVLKDEGGEEGSSVGYAGLEFALGA